MCLRASGGEFMGWEAWFALAVLAAVFYQLAFTRVPADLALVSGVVLLMFAGILSTKEALAGFSNEGMISVGVLYVISAGMRETGGITWVAERLLGRPKSARGAISRLMLPTAFISAFMNNTPLVAMLIPAVGDWAKQYRISVSKLMIPLSYAAILGGTCTLIGTSTNLVVNGLVKDFVAQRAKDAAPEGEGAKGEGGSKGSEGREAVRVGDLSASGLGMWDITPVGLPAALLGVAFIVLASRWLLPDRKPAISDQDDPRQYMVEMSVLADSPLVGKTIEQAGLRHLPGVYLAEIDRGDVVLPAVSPHERLRAADRLVFVGIVESVVDLRKIRGLAPATDQVAKIGIASPDRCLIEAVVSSSCPIVGKSIRDGKFRSLYNAAVIAVARDGERIRKKIGDIVLQAGDTLLLESHPSFADRQRNSRDFFLVSRIENSTPPRHEKAVIAIGILLALVVAMTTERIPFMAAVLGAAGLMLLTGCTTMAEARRSIDWETLLAIAASFGIGRALETTGAAAFIGRGMIDSAGGNAWFSLAVVYGVTLLVTELITNNAAAALMFPLAMNTAATLGVNYMPFVAVVMMAASAGFATPIGYQTNLMVYGPGGYRFSDYLRVGVPLDLLVWGVTVVVTPLVFPFR